MTPLVDDRNKYALFSSFVGYSQVIPQLNPNLSQLNPDLSHLNPDLSQLNPNLSQSNPNLSQSNPPNLSYLKCEIVTLLFDLFIVFSQ
jgi:hypothetical protein